jgi:acetylornithine deacetylase/succinyl-diaminopimelate desuccinylase-like protein
MRIEEKLDELEAIDYEVEDVLYVPAVEVDGKEEVVESMVEAYEQGIGEKPRVEGIGPWNNGWVFIQKDIPAIIQVPLRGGISRWGVEWVSMPSLKKLTVAVALTIVNYLGMKKKL